MAEKIEVMVDEGMTVGNGHVSLYAENVVLVAWALI